MIESIRPPPAHIPDGDPISNSGPDLTRAMLGPPVTTFPIPGGAYYIRNHTSQKLLELGHDDFVVLRPVAEDSHKASLFTPQFSCHSA
jgi:hypothetical protein